MNKINKLQESFLFYAFIQVSALSENFKSTTVQKAYEGTNK